MAEKDKRVVNQQIRLNSPWLQNTLRSLGVSATSTLSTLLPATSGTISTAKKTIGEINRDVRELTRDSRYVKKKVLQSPIIGLGRDFVQTAVEDFKSGEWDKDRSEAGKMEEEMNTMFDDMDSWFTDEDEPEGSVDIANVNVNTTEPEVADATVRAIDYQTTATIKSGQAQVDTMVTMNSQILLKMDEVGTKVVSELTGIGGTLNSMLEYYNSNFTRFIEASIGFYEQQSAPKVETSSFDAKVKPENLFSEKGLDAGAYLQYVKQNLKDYKDNFGGGIISLIVENKDMLIANPMKMIAEMTMQSLVPTVTKEAMTLADDAVKNFVPFALERISHLGEDNRSGFGAALRAVGEIFGVDVSMKKGFLFSNIETKPLPYNTKVDHTLVEIIPKYLRDGNNYLRVIAEHLTQKTADEMKGDVLGFNWSTNRFSKMSDFEEDIVGGSVGSFRAAFDKSKFGKALANAKFNLFSDDINEQETFDNLLSQFYLNLVNYNGKFNMNDPEIMNKLLEGVKTSEKSRHALEAVIADMIATDNPALHDVYFTRFDARQRLNTRVKSLEDDAYNNGLYQLYGDRPLVKEDFYKDLMEYIQRQAPDTTPNPSNIPPIIPIDALRNRLPFIRNAPTPEPQEDVSVDAFRQRLQDNRDSDISPTPSPSDTQRQSIGEIAAAPFRTVSSVLRSMMSGNYEAAWDKVFETVSKPFITAGNVLNDNFITPIKTAILGTRSDSGHVEGGLFESVNNRLVDTFYEFRKKLTGAGYTDASGATIPPATPEEKQHTLVGKLNSAVNWTKDAISERLFGSNEEEDESRGVIPTVSRKISGATETLRQGLVGWRDALFGPPEEEYDENGEVIRRTITDQSNEILANIKAKVSDVLPDALLGAGVGGILGTIAGGPVAGALIGTATGILAKSDKFNDWLFGTEDSEGIISKELQEKVKKNAKFYGGGALLGGITGASGIGLLGSIAGGPVAGAMMGLGSSIFLKSSLWEKFWLGDPEKGIIGMKNNIKYWTSGFTKNLKGEQDGPNKALGMSILGTAGGGILGALVGAPVLGAALGFGSSMLAQAGNFRTWLFGETDEETGARKEGIIGQVRNMIMTEVVSPVKSFGKYLLSDAKSFMEYEVLGPLGLVVESIGNTVSRGIHRTMGYLGATVSDIGIYIKENFLENFVDTIGNIISPIRDVAVKTADLAYRASKTLITAPIKLATAFMNPVFAGIGSVVKTATGAVLGTVNTLVVKPLEFLVVKPLGAAVKMAGAVIAAPFKMVSKGLHWIEDTLTKPLRHFGRFMTTVADDIGASIRTAVVEPLRQTAINFGKSVGDTITMPIKIAGTVMKDTMAGLGEYAKLKIDKLSNQASGLVGKMFNGLFGLIRKSFIGRMVGGAFNLITGKGPAEGGLIDTFQNSIIGRGLNRIIPKRDRSERQPGGLKAYLANAWARSEAGYVPDYSDTLLYDEDGNPVDRKISIWDALHNMKKDRASQREKIRDDYAKAKDRDYNQRMIRKYTNNQRWEDTDENRAIAEAAMKQKGLDPKWKGEPIRNTLDEATLRYQETDIEQGEILNNYVAQLAKFLLGGKFKPFTAEQEDERADLAEETGYKSQARRSTVREVIRELASSEGYRDREKSKDHAIVERNIEAREDRKRRNTIRDDVRLGHLTPSQFLRERFRDFRGRMDAHRDSIEARDAEIDMNADGTESARAGLSVVGERGPEVVYRDGDTSATVVGVDGPEVIRLQGGETIIPNDRIGDTPNIIMESDPNQLSIGERILQALNNITNAIPSVDELKNIIPAVDDLTVRYIPEVNTVPTVDLEEAAQDSVSQLTSENLRAAREEAEKEERKEALTAEQNATLRDIRRSQDEHYSIWDSVFSTKGMFTVAMMALIPTAIKFFQTDIGKAITDGIAGALRNIGNIFGDTVNNVTEQAATVYEQDGLQNGESVADRTANQLDRVVNGGLIDGFIFDRDGNADHQSASRIGLAASIAQDVIHSSVSSPLQSDATSTVKGISNVVKNITNKTVTAVKDNKLYQRVSKAVAGFLDNILTKFKVKSGLVKVGNVFKGLSTFIDDAIVANWEKISLRFASVVGVKAEAAAASAALSEAIFITIGAINGASNTAQLFHVNQSAVTPKMRIISTLFGGITGTTLGSIIDVVSSVIYETTGVDLLSAVASALYNAWTDDEAAEKLAEAQKQFSEEYNKYQEAEIAKQYEAQKMAGLIDSGMTLTEFSDKVHSGEIAGVYDSVAQHNATVNASIGDKFANALSDGWQGLKNIGATIVGSTETQYTDTRGNKYVSNGDGTVTVTTMDGKTGIIAEDALKNRDDITEITVEQAGILKKFKDTALNAMDATADEFLTKVNVVGDRSKTYFLPQGGYYKFVSGRWNRYGMAGDLLESNIDEETVYNMLAMGLITAGDVDHSVSRKAIATLGEVFKDAWSVTRTYARGGEVQIPTVPTVPTTGGRGQPKSLNGIPYYSQNDTRWSNEKFIQSNGVDDGATMGDTGCGPTAMSMVVSSMTGKDTKPTELARLAQVTGNRDYTGTNWDFIKESAEKYGLSANQIVAPTMDDVVSKLQSGNPMILSGTDSGYGTTPYTTAGHYVVATGIDSSGNVTYNDPRGVEYSGKKNIKDFIFNTGAAWDFAHAGIGEAETEDFKDFGVSLNSNKGDFRPRLDRPWADNPYYVRKDKGGYSTAIKGSPVDPYCDVLPNCVGYAYGRFNEIGDYDYMKYLQPSNAETFMDNRGNLRASLTPSLGSVMVWKQGSTSTGDDGPGHVAIVEKILDNDTVVTSESGYNANKAFWTQERKRGSGNWGQSSKYDFRGFIHNPAVKNGATLGEPLDHYGFDYAEEPSLGQKVVSGASDFLGKLTGGISTLFKNVFGAVLSGNMSIDWKKAFADSDSSATTDSTGPAYRSIVDQTAVPTNISAGGQSVEIAQYLQNKGLKAHEIAGIIGCWGSESSHIPGIIEGQYMKAFPKGLDYINDRAGTNAYTENILWPALGKRVAKEYYYGDDGNKYPGIGLAQWTGPRGQNFAEFVKNNNRKLGDLNTDLDFFWSELQPGGARPKTLDKLADTNSPEEAARVFSKNYEGFAVEAGVMAREKSARQAYNEMVNGGSGDGPSITKQKHQPVEPVEKKVEAPKATIRPELNVRKVFRDDVPVRKFVDGGYGQGFDDSNVIQLLTKVVDYLGNISTNTRQLETLKDIRDNIGVTKSININNTSGGSNTIVSTGGKSSGYDRHTPKVSQNELIAMSIAGL